MSYTIALPATSVRSGQTFTARFLAKENMHLLRLHFDTRSSDLLTISKLFLGNDDLMNPSSLGEWEVSKDYEICRHKQVPCSQVNLSQFNRYWETGQYLTIEVYNRLLASVELIGCVWVAKWGEM